mgnify:CR=1 FL=1
MGEEKEEGKSKSTGVGRHGRERLGSNAAGKGRNG